MKTLNKMKTIIIIFSIISIVLALIVLFVLYRKLPSKNEKLKLIIPLIIALIIGAACYLIGVRPPTCEFGRFM